MSLFSKLLGGGAPQNAKPEGDHAREFERVQADGSALTINSTGKTYPIHDLSLGGMSFDGYEGKLRGNQYFEFTLKAVKDGVVHETGGMAIVVRVKNERVAAKFPPQPRLRSFLRDFFD